MSQTDGDDPIVGMTGARFGSSRSRRRRTADDAAAAAVTEPLPVTPPPGEPVSDPGRPDDEFLDADYGEEGIARIAVRPYVLTGGRTRPAVELAIEALVSVPAGVERRADRRTDHAAVLDLCGVPRSIAEIAALLQMPLGVARVLVGDLAESGAVIVHRTSGAAGPDMTLLERVLGGLRKL